LSSVLKLFWAFLPTPIQIAILAFFALLAILLVLKIIAKVLEAIPFL
jgi:hypothetical protein